MAGGRVIEPDLEMIRQVKKAGGATLKNCFQCATCSVVCNLTPDEKPFPRKEMILAGWGQADQLIKDPDIWLCYQCNDCSIHCPRGARPGDVLAAVRGFVYRHFAFPSFMGRALPNPKALPVLIGIPVVILAILMFIFAPRTDAGGLKYFTVTPVDFNTFIPFTVIDVLFVSTVSLALICALVGFYRFWKALNQNPATKQRSFMQGLILTLKDVIFHKNFNDCGTNKPRFIGHLLTFYGFIGAFITTSLVFVFIFIPEYLHLWFGLDIHPLWELPLDLPHPVKILGGLSSIALVVGLLLMINRRLTQSEKVGANGYLDYLFLAIIFLTALTGVGAWLIRVTGMHLLAGITYYVHLVCVFCLLIYGPYSKFAHVVYRSLALIYLRTVGRETAQK